MMGFNPRMFKFFQGANLFVERAHVRTYVRAEFVHHLFFMATWEYDGI